MARIILKQEEKRFGFDEKNTKPSDAKCQNPLTYVTPQNFSNDIKYRDGTSCIGTIGQYDQ